MRYKEKQRKQTSVSTGYTHEKIDVIRFMYNVLELFVLNKFIF